jgi:hypothetical protein
MGDHGFYMDKIRAVHYTAVCAGTGPEGIAPWGSQVPETLSLSGTLTLIALFVPKRYLAKLFFNMGAIATMWHIRSYLRLGRPTKAHVYEDSTSGPRICSS